MLKKLKTPIIIILVFVSLLLIWDLLNLPPDEVLIEMARNFFFEYGFMAVFLAAIIEGVLVVGWYLPGGVVIFLGVILASGDLIMAALSVLITILGFCIAYIFNYFLGKYGWYRVLIIFGLRDSLKKAEGSFQKYGNRAIFLSYWQPNLAALVSTSAGILRVSFKKFFIYSTLATIFWSAFWGIIAYTLGQKVLSYLGAVFFGIMFVWIIYIIVEYYFFGVRNTSK